MGILWAVGLPISQWWSLRASDRVLQVVNVQWTIRWHKLEILHSSWKGLKLQNLCCSNAAVMPWQTWSCNFVDPTEICIAHMQSHSQYSQLMSPYLMHSAAWPPHSELHVEIIQFLSWQARPTLRWGRWPSVLIPLCRRQMEKQNKMINTGHTGLVSLRMLSTGHQGPPL